MAAINFPASPTNGQIFTSGDKTWIYSTAVSAWKLQTQTLTGPTGPAGPAVADGGITTIKIADGAVTTAKIGALAVTTAKIASGAVTATELATDAVTTAKIAASAVTNTKIASGIDATKVTGVYYRSGATAANQITLSTAAPTGGADGDIWMKY